MPTLPGNDKAQLEYMNKLRSQALKQIDALSSEQLKSLAFDPQGRVLIEVTHEGKPATVSVDIGSSDALRAAFQQKLYLGEPKVDPEAAKNYLEQPRGSVIPLQQELHFHLAAANRVLTEKFFPDEFAGKSAEVSLAFKQATEDVNLLVTDAFKTALNEATKDDKTIDVAVLNKALDQARKKIAPQAHIKLLRAIAQNTGVELRSRDLDTKKIKHIAEETSATVNDVLVLDSQLNSATLIKGSEQTAHNRMRTDKPKDHKSVKASFAHREMITQQLSAKGITAKTRSRIQIRTPSPVVKDLGLFGKKKFRDYFRSDSRNKDAAADVANKLQEVVNNYDLDNVLQAPKNHASMPKAFIYNRHTAFNDRLDEAQGKNKQTQSAKHILKGAHSHNKANLNDGVMCFVQNISVNGYGKTLSDGVMSNDLQKETTLMAEIAMLHSNYDQLQKPQQDQVKEVINQYKHFLENNDNPEVFFSSKEGKQAKSEIQAIKASIQENGLKAKPANTADLAKQTLLKLMANDQHHSHDNAKTIQALSVFVEDASISGCKSGNERAEAINKRVAVLDALEMGSDKKEVLAIEKALEGVASNYSEQAVAQLNTALNTALNNLALQSAPTVVSHTDQHAGAKVEAKKPYSRNPIKAVTAFFQNINRNRAESSDMSNLQQSKASKMQAHKSFSEYLDDAVKPKAYKEPKGFFGPIKRFFTKPSDKMIKAKQKKLDAKLAAENKEDIKIFKENIKAEIRAAERESVNKADVEPSSVDAVRPVDAKSPEVDTNRGMSLEEHLKESFQVTAKNLFKTDKNSQHDASEKKDQDIETPEDSKENVSAFANSR